MLDKEIIDLLFDRDEKALSNLSEKYGRYCRKITENILDSREDSEECVNETYMKVWQSIPPNRPTSLKAYVGRIARNAAFNTYKAQNAEKRRANETALALDELGEILGGEDSLMGELEKRRLEKCIDIFVHNLPKRDCDIFVGRYFSVESTSELAEKHGIRQENVRLILSRTRQKLKEFLEQEGFSL